MGAMGMEQPRKPRGRLNASQMDSIRRGQSARSDAGARAQEGKTRPAPKRPVGAKAALAGMGAWNRPNAVGCENLARWLTDAIANNGLLH